MKYLVVKNEEIEGVSDYKETLMLDTLLHKVETLRSLQGKNPVNSYLVVNVDEPYAGDIADTIEVNERLKGTWEQGSKTLREIMGIPFDEENIDKDPIIVTVKLQIWKEYINRKREEIKEISIKIAEVEADKIAMLQELEQLHNSDADKERYTAELYSRAREAERELERYKLALSQVPYSLHYLEIADKALSQGSEPKDE